MNSKILKVLLIAEQCNPDWPSVPLVAYNFFQNISRIADVTLVTHERNREAFEKLAEFKNIDYVRESNFSKKYHQLVEGVAVKGRINWPLYHALAYPIYLEFNRTVYQKFRTRILEGDYDIVHALTPMMPRYPVKAIKACKHTPFLLGPVNGGIPFPPGFQETAKKESANFNFLRALGRFLIPGYVETYKKADKILAGSTFTLSMLKELFSISDRKIELFYENGISKDFLSQKKKPKDGDNINLLFVGRLVPYKCADIVVEAVSQLDKTTQDRVLLTIVGDGSEKGNLEQKVQELNLGKFVRLMGKVTQQETLEYYNSADIFCFPSIREFGGAVVLEAMACGLPCIVADHGGIGEYVTKDTGFKIEPVSREYLVQELKEKITVLVKDENLRKSMSARSVDRVQEFEWENKAKKIVAIYRIMISENNKQLLSER